MEYEINYDTLAIIPLEENKIKIMEDSSEYYIDTDPISILEHSCEYFGSSYDGRKEGTKKLIGISHKTPIIVEESRKIIFFPTCSPEKNDCIWINLEKIEKYYRTDSYHSAIEFKNGEILDLNISYGSLSNQILRATRLKYVLEDRILKKEDNNL